jgi:tetrahydromethanopterin S-methyltransferase subunit E
MCFGGRAVANEGESTRKAITRQREVTVCCQSGSIGLNRVGVPVGALVFLSSLQAICSIAAVDNKVPATSLQNGFEILFWLPLCRCG